MPILPLTRVSLILKLKETETKKKSPRLAERDLGIVSLMVLLIDMLFGHLPDSAVVKSVCSREIAWIPLPPLSLTRKIADFSSALFCLVTK